MTANVPKYFVSETSTSSLRMSESDKERQERASRFMVVIAECLGTATLMIIGCMGCVVGIYNNQNTQWAPFIFGLAVASAIQIFGHISGGHYNPVVTVAAVIMNKIEFIRLPLYWIAQFVGAFLGYGFVWLVTPSQFSTGLCVTVVHPTVENYQAVFIEAVGTAFLVWLCCAVWDGRLAAQQDSVSLRLGLMLSGVFVSAAGFTGCSLNPARSFAPAVIQNIWTQHWVYWIGPPIGAIISAFIYKYSFIEGLGKLAREA